MSRILESIKCCLNPKVLIGLATVGVGVVLLAPNLIAAAVPLLLALVCPLSMLAMMVGMARMGTKQQGSHSGVSIMASKGAPAPELPISADARLALLRAQQQVLAAQNAAIAAEIGTLEAAEPVAQHPIRALRQAERVAALAAPGAVANAPKQ